MQAELGREGWSESVMASLRYLLAAQQEIDERQSLDPLQWAKYLYKYRELPHIMTPWKEEASPDTQQHVYKVYCLTTLWHTTVFRLTPRVLYQVLCDDTEQMEMAAALFPFAVSLQNRALCTAGSFRRSRSCCAQLAVISSTLLEKRGKYILTACTALLQHVASLCRMVGSVLSVAAGLQVLYEFCSRILASKPTTLEADLQLLEQLPSSTGSSDRQRLALQFRIGKKALLKSCIWQYDPTQMTA